ncbi:uncharacterized protein RJT21DRAFT_126885 [Scheffersomyces amazonensis]|uniref:uncharacterized protein n=1 Tax=Scheffersomyces amazonensis TaxID=1078765 RepID=UPI00315D7CD5
MFRIGQGIGSKVPGLSRSYYKKAVITVNDKVTVQLLKDVKDIGIKGELLRVKSAYMRNCLQHGGKAAYVTKTKGPTIPVVVRQYVEEKETPKSEIIDKPSDKESETKAKNKAEALSLDELSQLFNSMRRRKSIADADKQSSTFQIAKATEEVSFILTELNELIPNNHTFRNSKFPITKTNISSLLFNLTGEQIPQSVITLEKSTTPIEEIQESGDYTLIIKSPAEKSSITKHIVFE